jgi:hypothetical protein
VGWHAYHFHWACLLRGGNGSFVAADASAGKTLWSFPANAANWHASPMAYQFDGKEFIAIVSGGNIIALTNQE